MPIIQEPDFGVLIKISWSLIWRSALWHILGMIGIMIICGILIVPVAALNTFESLRPVMTVLLVLVFILMFILFFAVFIWAFAMAFKQVLRKTFNHPQLGLLRQTEDHQPEDYSADDLVQNPGKMVLFKLWWGVFWRSFLCWVAAEFLLYTIVRLFLTLMPLLTGNTEITVEDFRLFEGIMGIVLTFVIYALVLKHMLGNRFNDLRLEIIDHVRDQNSVAPADHYVEIEDSYG